MTIREMTEEDLADLVPFYLDHYNNREGGCWTAEKAESRIRQVLPLLQCGYTEDELATASPADMDAYYSPDRQARYGVVGIELQLE